MGQTNKKNPDTKITTNNSFYKISEDQHIAICSGSTWFYTRDAFSYVY